MSQSSVAVAASSAEKDAESDAGAAIGAGAGAGAGAGTGAGPPSGSVVVDVEVVVVVADDGLGSRPRCLMSDFRFGAGVGAVVDTAAAVVDDVDAVVAVAVFDFRRHEGYPSYPDADHSVALFSAAVLVAAAVDTAAAVAAADRGPGVDEALGGARTTTDEIPDLADPLSIFFFSFSALLSMASLKFLALLSPGLSPLSIASFLALFLSPFVCTFFFPIAFLSAVLLFSFVNSSAVTLTTPSRPAAPFQSLPNCGFFPLLLSPACCSAFLSVQHPRCPIST